MVEVCNLPINTTVNQGLNVLDHHFYIAFNITTAYEELPRSSKEDIQLDETQWASIC